MNCRPQLTLLPVIPAQAGIQFFGAFENKDGCRPAPA
jgi:hypothetical protein